MRRRDVLFLFAAIGAGAALPHAQAPAVTTDSRARFLAVIDRPRVAAVPAVSALVVKGRIAWEEFTFSTEAGQRVPGLTAAPAGAPTRRPAVIVLHGTGDSKEGMIPLLEAFANRGFLAVAIDGRYHGVRAIDTGAYIRAILQAYRTGREHPFLYDTAWDALRLVDYLQTRNDVDGRRIGMLGISKGGMETYLAAAADPRIAAAVPVIAVQSFAWALDNNAWQARVETILGAVAGAAREEFRPVDADFVRDFYDRVVPGIYDDFDAPAMLPLIAPRPLLVINGDSDALTPRAGVELSARAAERAYRDSSASDKFKLLMQRDTGHELTPDGQRTAIDWMAKWLKP